MVAIVPLIERIKAMAEKDDRKPFSEGGVSASSAIQKEKKWTFTDTLAQQPTSFFEPILLDHRLLMMEYNALRDQLDDSFSRKKRNKELLINQVSAALIVSELLDKIYEREYLDTWQDVELLRREQALYRQWLTTQGYEFLAPYNEKNINRSHPWLRTRSIRNVATTVNPFRLFFVRLRRMFVLMAIVINDFEHYGRWLNAVEQYSGPFFAYMAWIFFLPRLIANLAVLGKHVLFPVLSERDIPWHVRFRAQLSRRWAEIANDAGWFTSGIIACFILTGPLLPMAILLAFTIQCYDFTVNGIRAIHEYRCMCALEKKYLNMYESAKNDGKNDDAQAIDRYLVHLRKRMTVSKKSLMLNIVNFGILVAAIAMALPWIAVFSPILPLVGAILAVVITIVNYVVGNMLRAQNGNQLNNKFKEELKKPVEEKQKPVEGRKENSLFKQETRNAGKKSVSASALDNPNKTAWQI
jgi:hypothetical protein